MLALTLPWSSFQAQEKYSPGRKSPSRLQRLMSRVRHSSTVFFLLQRYQLPDPGPPILTDSPHIFPKSLGKVTCFAPVLWLQSLGTSASSGRNNADTGFVRFFEGSANTSRAAARCAGSASRSTSKPANVKAHALPGVKLTVAIPPLGQGHLGRAPRLVLLPPVPPSAGHAHAAAPPVPVGLPRSNKEGDLFTWGIQKTWLRHHTTGGTFVSAQEVANGLLCYTQDLGYLSLCEAFPT